MASRQRDQLVAIRITHRGDHADVVAARSIERVRVGIGVRPDSVDLLSELLDGLDETGIAAQLIQGPVKMKVAVKYRQQITAVDRRTVLALDVLELVDVAAGDGERQNSNGHDLQFFAYGVDLRDFFRREVADHRPAIGNTLNNPLFLQFEKGEADVGAVRVELLAQILFDQALARMASAQHDVFFEARRNALGGGRPAHAAFRSCFGPLFFWRL